jgi:hypothetical protein
MTLCKGSQAEEFGLAYVEGSLDANQAASFEEHFFECSNCEKYVIELQRVAKQMRLHPMDATAVLRGDTNRVRLWPKLLKPTLAWGLPMAAVVLIGVFVARGNWHSAGSTDEAKNTQVQLPAVNSTGASTSTTQTSKPAATATTTASGNHKAFSSSQLADLRLPVFVMPGLRDDSSDSRFLAGMKAYTAGDCRTAVASLALVPVNSNDARAARLFTGACQLKMGKVQAAENNLHIVVDAGDTPQLEWALYELAQAALATNDTSTAHDYLQKVIALRGDLEVKARTEDGKVSTLLSAKEKPATSFKSN